MAEYAIIPRPVSVQYTTGNFQCDDIPMTGAVPEVFQSAARVFEWQMRQCFGETAGSGKSGSIDLQKTENPVNDESYRIEILPGKIRLSAATETGIFRALQSLRQLVLSGYHEGKTSIPCGIIEDLPRFGWRGFMLDCSRQFYTAEFIKRLLDTLSLQHINIFHWHLSDDQGWRLPVAKYPLLAEIGSKRLDRRRRRYIGGFYTDAEIRDIVSFAAERHIEVVPEIDLPGHTSAVLAVYPALGCTGGPYRVEDRFGIFDEVLCAGNDEIFNFMEAVFDTLVDFFPSKFVHIGGDEVLFQRWTECPKCKKRLAELGLSKPDQLQSWITSRMARMLADRGKTAIGWDEVLENIEQFPLPDDFIVMSWRGAKGGNKAASLGRRVIMTPNTSGCYLDYKHKDSPEEPGNLGISTITQGYNLNPITPEMDKNAAALVLGGQGNLWSELIYAGKIAEYMAFPRICAIAEALWTGGETRNLAEFRSRLVIHQNRLDRLGILQYRGE